MAQNSRPARPDVSTPTARMRACLDGACRNVSRLYDWHKDDYDDPVVDHMEIAGQRITILMTPELDMIESAMENLSDALRCMDELEETSR